MRADSRSAADGSLAARAGNRGQSNTGGAACAGKGEKDVFLFLGEKIGRCFLCLLGSDSSRGAAIAALGYRHCRRGKRRAQLRHGVETQLVEDCGLWPPFQLIQLVYLRYLYVGTEREKRMDVCFLLTLYI